MNRLSVQSLTVLTFCAQWRGLAALLGSKSIESLIMYLLSPLNHVHLSIKCPEPVLYTFNNLIKFDSYNVQN